jgi:hypothetical protein
MIGGSLAEPAVHLGLRGPGELFVRFPFLLPCLCSATANSCAFVASSFLLDETNRAKITGTPEQEAVPPQASQYTENDPLLPSQETAQVGMLAEDQDSPQPSASTRWPPAGSKDVSNSQLKAQASFLISAL